MTELKPCPFCGGKAVILEHNRIYRIQCEKCWIRTANNHSEICAVLEWNNRVGETK